MSTRFQRFALVLTVALAVAPLTHGQPEGGKQPTALPEGLRHVPADALGFAHFRVADFLASDTGKAVLAQILQSKEIAGGLEKVASDIGMSLRDVESITLIVQAPMFNRQDNAGKAADVEMIQRLRQEQMRVEDFRAMAEAERRRAEEAARQAEQELRRLLELKKEAQNKPKLEPTPECDDDCMQPEAIADLDFSEDWFAPTVIVTASKAFERKKLLRLAAQNEQHEQNALIFLSDRSILIGPTPRLVQYVDRVSKEGSKGAGPLTRALTLATEKDEQGKAKYVLVAGSHVPDAVRHFLLRKMDDHGQAPAALAMLYPLAALESMALAVDLGAPIVAKVQFYGANAKSANLALEGAKTALARAQIELEDRLAEDPPLDGNKLLIDFIGDLSKALQAAETQQTGNVGTLTLRLDLPAKKLALAAQLLGGQVQLSSRRVESTNNLKQIALAMHNYHDVYNGFPPAGIGKDGKPLLSWRVAILPFIEQQPLYNQFDLNLPWDHPKNKKLIAQMPAIYAAPGVKSKEPGLTHYQVFVGPGTPFEPLPGKGPGMVGRRLTHIADGTSNTFMVAEAGEPVIWTKPDDLNYDDQKPLPKLGGLFPNGFNVAFCDGSVRFISNKVKEPSLRILITGNDGMVVPEDVFQESSNRGFGRTPTATKSVDDVPAKSPPKAPDSKDDEAPKEQPEGRGARLSGKVTAQGQPLPGGQILLRNAKDVFEGAINADGTFQFVNLPIGEYRVVIRKAQQAPARYAEFETSALAIRLRPAVNVIDLDLK